MAKILGLEFAPLNIPMERRMQTLSVLAMSSMFFLFPIACLVIFILLLFSSYSWIALAYSAWLVYDIGIAKTSSRGGRRWRWIRQTQFMANYSNYFPVTLTKTADLDPSKNYLFGSHPHGIMGCGSVANFATETTGFNEKFPGITPHLLTLKFNFYLPFLRGFILAMGVCDVSKESIQWILTKQGTGNAAIVVVGGAEEALEAHPGSYNLTLKKRKGFVKQAIKAGANLVPVFSFGENDLFYQLDNNPGTYVRAIQETFKHLLGFSSPYFYGRGIFNYSFGFLPHRRPIHTIVGKPIDVTKDVNPSKELVNEIHQKYMDNLEDLFEKHKGQHGVDPDTKLTFI